MARCCNGGVVKLVRFGAVITLDPAAGPSAREYASGTRPLLVHGTRDGEPGTGKFFPAMMTRDDEEKPLRPRDHAVVTVTIADAEAPAYLAAGQHFGPWGAGGGHGAISRPVCTTAGPGKPCVSQRQSAPAIARAGSREAAGKPGGRWQPATEAEPSGSATTARPQLACVRPRERRAPPG